MTSIVEKTDVPADARLPTAHGEFEFAYSMTEIPVSICCIDVGGNGWPDPVLVKSTQNA